MQIQISFLSFFESRSIIDFFKLSKLVLYGYLNKKEELHWAIIIIFTIIFAKKMCIDPPSKTLTYLNFIYTVVQKVYCDSLTSHGSLSNFKLASVQSPCVGNLRPASVIYVHTSSRVILSVKKSSEQS